MTRRTSSDLLDRRARLAAAHLLLAFQLPAPADAAARQMQQAARVCPGVTMGEIGAMGGPGAVREHLLKSRALIDELLAELP